MYFQNGKSIGIATFFSIQINFKMRNEKVCNFHRKFNIEDDLLLISRTFELACVYVFALKINLDCIFASNFRTLWIRI